MTEIHAAGAANRLIHETSPYLLQHAHNPVDWHPWGPEALRRAQAEDKPILLSVGYSACHWCHVMAHESFEDPETAAMMNELFVNIKVDREERPDIDAIYMEAVQAMTGHGGWPMTVFLTPEGKPFYGGTYFPPAPRQGMPGFRQVMQAIAGDAPKFPQPMNLDFLLAAYLRTRDATLLQAVTYTLTKMAWGGIYDQIGGGFHRYSTDALWLVPHFEKMLYDNAQLARTYLHAWQVTHNPLFRRIVEETLDYVLREMTDPAGGFYSAQDADSEGEEGKFFLWRPVDLAALLGPADARLFSAYYGVTARGNFPEGGPGASILYIQRDAAVVAADLGVSVEKLLAAVERGRKTLFAARAQRVAPGRDDKVLAEWNGLMLQAFAEAGAALDRPDYIAAARRAAEFLLREMAQEPENSGSEAAAAPPASGFQPSASSIRLYRTYKAGRAHLNAYLEDYAAVALGLVALYQVTFEREWLAAAAALAQTIVANFRDPARGGFFQTSNDHEALVARRKDFIDSALPSGNSLVAELFLRLSRLLDRPEGVADAEGVMQVMANAMAQQPDAFGRLLCALELYLHPGVEIALVGDPAAAETRALLAEVRGRFLPNSVIALAAAEDAESRALIPLLADRGALGGQPTAYVCRNYVCNLPVTRPAELARQLDGSR
ncbi:MAG: Glycosyl Hydrolase Family 88 [Chloroflexi bacterium ADurb.Bin325]|nr:MAG: Glycosyl Hydrolase Family 88 [Chloroflexi bacterium ADurb.Bin325]